MFLFDANHNQLATGSVDLAGQPAGQYAYVSVGPIELLAGQSYYLLSMEATWTGNDLVLQPEHYPDHYLRHHYQ